MNSYTFHVVIVEDKYENNEKAFHASCPLLKGCHTWGYTYDEALANIKVAIELYVTDMIEAGETIPHEREQNKLEPNTRSVVVHV